MPVNSATWLAWGKPHNPTHALWSSIDRPINCYINNSLLRPNLIGFKLKVSVKSALRRFLLQTCLVIGNSVCDLFFGSFRAFPTTNFDPLAFFQVFVVFKKVGNGF
jgi:hypothetical protein